MNKKLSTRLLAFIILTSMIGIVSADVAKNTLTSITVYPSTSTLKVGENQTFIATALDQNRNTMENVDISWLISNSTFGSVNPVKGVTDSNGNVSTIFTATKESGYPLVINAVNDSVVGNAVISIPLTQSGTISGNGSLPPMIGVVAPLNIDFGTLHHGESNTVPINIINPSESTVSISVLLTDNGFKGVSTGFKLPITFAPNPVVIGVNSSKVINVAVNVPNEAPADTYSGTIGVMAIQTT